MDWALARQGRVENALAARHLANGTLVLYDVSSAAFEGRTCPLGAIGHARDGVKGRRQIVYGLLCSTAGVPVAIEVFEGNTADPKTLARQITKLKTRFGLQRVCLVGDRGMLTNARIRDELRPAQLDWLSALRPRRSRPWSKMARCSCRCSTQQNLVEIDSPDFPGERLIVLPQPGIGRGPRPHTPRAAGRHRERTGQDRRGHPSRAPPVARARQDRPAGRQGHRPLQHGQALHHRDHRRGVHVHPQHRDHRRRGRPRRDLRAAHQPARRHPHRRRCGAATTRDSQTSNGSSVPSTARRVVVEPRRPLRCWQLGHLRGVAKRRDRTSLAVDNRRQRRTRSHRVQPPLRHTRGTRTGARARLPDVEHRLFRPGR